MRQLRKLGSQRCLDRHGAVEALPVWRRTEGSEGGSSATVAYDKYCNTLSTMSVVLPGELIHTQHQTVKLGPGLQQSADLQGKAAIVVTRAGILEQNAKGNKFWVEGNSRRVRASTVHLSVRRLTLRRSMCRRCKNL
jgi:hypothetical protein